MTFKKLDSNKLCDGEYGKEILLNFGFKSGMNSCDVDHVNFIAEGRRFWADAKVKFDMAHGEFKAYLEVHEVVD